MYARAVLNWMCHIATSTSAHTTHLMSYWDMLISYFLCIFVCKFSAVFLFVEKLSCARATFQSNKKSKYLFIWLRLVVDSCHESFSLSRCVYVCYKLSTANTFCDKYRLDRYNRRCRNILPWINCALLYLFTVKYNYISVRLIEIINLKSRVKMKN